jgi:collagenase-like PrtC family protease
MILLCPSNWDDGLLPALRALGLRELYAGVPWSPAAGGRAAMVQGSVDEEAVRRHLSRARQLGMRVSYLLNAPRPGAEHGPVLEHVARRVEQGIAGVTVADPALLGALRSSFPQLEIRVSTIAHVADPDRIQAFADAGADEIHLSWDLNRELSRLESLARAAPVPLSLLVNDGCVHRCPRRVDHYQHISERLCSHEGQRPDRPEEAFSRRCAIQRLEAPEELLLSPFVRPEDLGRYEAIGIERFKVVGRTKSTEHILRMARAWSRRTSPDNLVEILDLAGRPRRGMGLARLALLRDDPLGRSLGRGLVWAGRAGGWLGRGSSGRGLRALAGLGELDPTRAAELVAAADAMGRFAQVFRIDPVALDGFLEAWQELPEDQPEARRVLARHWAERALSVDERLRKSCLAALGALDD